jgi:hypothetical protein
MHSRPVTYVCLLSRYPIASAQAIKHLRPESVIVLSSKLMADRGREECFRKVVEGWGVRLTVIGSADVPLPLPVESMIGCAAWMRHHLEPGLQEERRKGRRLIANLTGSTKAAAWALDRLLDWDELHYTAESSRDRLEVVGHPAGGMFSLPNLEILEEARLLNQNVRQGENPWRDKEVAEVIRAAEAIHEDYRAGEGRSILKQHEALLRALWFGKKSEERSEALRRGGLELEGERAWVSPGPLQDLLGKAAVLEPQVCCVEGGRLGIPAGGKHRWSRFVAGFWWEHLVAEWVKRCACDMVQGVQIMRERDNGRAEVDSESDILLRRVNGELGLIECKVDSPDSKKLTDMALKMGDRAPFFGKASGAFSVSPAFWWNADGEAAAAFRSACKAREFALLETEEALRSWAADSGQRSRGEKLPEYVPCGR